MKELYYAKRSHIQCVMDSAATDNVEAKSLFSKLETLAAPDRDDITVVQDAPDLCEQAQAQGCIHACHLLSDPYLLASM